MNRIGEETLMAYVDGELIGHRRDEVERALVEDPELRARVEIERRLRARIAGHYAPVADEPVPERLAALVAGSNVVDFAEARARRSRPLWHTLTALAATLVAGLTLGTMLPRADGGGPVAFADGRMVARGELAEALETRLAAQGAGDDTRIGVSFASADGRYCRTFDSPALSGLACRGEEGWQVAAAAAPAAAQAGQFRQASSAGHPLVLQAAQEMMAGEPLDAEGERRARGRGWRNPPARD